VVHDDKENVQDLVNGCSLVDGSTTEDVTEDLISMESNDNGLNEEDENVRMTMDVDGYSSNASLSTTIGVELLPLEKAKSPVLSFLLDQGSSNTFNRKCIVNIVNGLYRTKVTQEI